MNIFFLEDRLQDEPLRDFAKRVAASHCDKHQKQVLEMWQILNTSCNVLGIKTDNSSVAYQNHPSTKWARESLTNWQFCIYLAEELALEMQRRYRRKEVHKSWLRIKENIPFNPPEIADKGLTRFAEAMPLEIRQSSPVASYRLYYNTHKAFFARRTKIKGTFGQDITAYKVEDASWKNQDAPKWHKPVDIDTALTNRYIKASDGKKSFQLSHADNIIY